MRKFFSWLWEHCGDGYIELRVLPPRTDGIIHHFTDLDSACSFASDRSASGQNVYFGVGLRSEPKGSSEYVSELPALWVDVDVKDFGGDMTAAKNSLWEASPSGRGKWNCIVESGGGYHAYRRLDRPAATEEEKALVSSANKLIAHRARGDMHCTDIARILRVPSTQNFKYDPARHVKARLFNVPDLSLDELARMIPKPHVSSPVTYADVPEDIERIVSGCAFMRHCVEDAATLSEPEWFAWISNLCHCHKSPRYIHLVSSKYPKYTRQETDEKILHALDGSAPITCDEIKKKWDCGMGCGVASPCGLAWRTRRIEVEENPFERGDKRKRALVEAAIPSGGWLHDYVRFAQTLTDAPTIFHLFSGLTTLGAALSRRAYCPGFGGRPVYPNLWTVLVAPSSAYRKSTAVNIARDLLSESGTKVYPDDFSKELLVDILQDSPRGCFVWGEFGNTLAQFDRDYMAGIKDLLADLYDCPNTYERRLRDKTLLVEDPCVSLLGATNTDWMLDKKNIRNDLRGGFLARILFVPHTERDYTLDVPGEVDVAARERLLGFLRDIRDRAVMEFSIDRLGGLRRELKEELEAAAKDSEYFVELSAAFTRYQVIALKIALILAVSTGRWNGDIPIECMEQAIYVIRLLRTSIVELLQAVPLNKDDALLVELLVKARQLHLQGSVWVTRRDLCRVTHRQIATLAPALASLVESGRMRKHDADEKYQITG